MPISQTATTTKYNMWNVLVPLTMWGMWIGQAELIKKHKQQDQREQQKPQQPYQKVVTMTMRNVYHLLLVQVTMNDVPQHQHQHQQQQQ